ncbi:NUDIX hydrolase [Actinomarinicola tropica]|uniref:NUDIX domain-containing protein n=1 Tax=Actinomarinicola tropica TaxID=2789776 RepID=A0A5Q2RJ95_9ACTN|nr:CoA pyrophosphatase [Actinomarinicola tropica]QGG93910.1 NUDIX domain-containing protein [Actinomarinicola tropica]
MGTEGDGAEEPIDQPVAPPAQGVPLGPPDVVRGGPQVIPRPSDWRPGAVAPWAELGADARRPDLEHIRRAVGVRPSRPVRLAPGELDGSARRASAVLAALYDLRGEPHVLLTRRSWNLRAHRGEVSFPGGTAEPSDPDLVATALREAEEEVGLPPAAVEVVGELDHLQTVTSEAFIVPYVGLLATRPPLRPDPREVAEIRDVPVAELLDDGVFREEIWSRDGVDRAIWFFELEGDTVWGATAAMLRDLLCRITGVEPGPSPGR